MKRLAVLLLISVLLWGCNPIEKPEVNNLCCEYFTNPEGIETLTPRLGWMIRSNDYGVTQSAFQVLVADNPECLSDDSGNIWDSGKVASGLSILVPYGGSPLKSGKKYYWKVRIWDQNGKESDWSETAYWQMGLLHPEDWEDAKWIGYEDMPDSMRVVPGIHGAGNNLKDKCMQRPVIPLFRKNFNVTGKITSATLFISGLGQYDAFLNGEKIGNAFLTPGWTDYDNTVFYNTWDVTSMLKKGENALGVIVGNGFYNINRERYRKLVNAFGMPKLICKLVVTCKDGSSVTVISDEKWKTAPSPTTYSSIYGGEDYNANLERTGWNEPIFNDSAWKQALCVHKPAGELHAERDYPVAVCEHIPVQKISKLADSTYLYDFGQNASGIISLKIKGKKGQQIRLFPAELIRQDGTANQKATGSPYFYTYTLKGEGEETWHPLFTYYGFRYVQVEGAIPAASSDDKENLPVVENLTLLHTRNSAPQNGRFECSDELFNRINKLITWAIKSNLQSVVTDCPHREKLGWMEQTFLMGTGINFNYDIYHLYRKLVYDMMDSQTAEGLIPDIAPEYVEFLNGFRDSPEWGSAGIILPWLLYTWYGDRRILETAWPMMNRYAEYLKGKSDNHILSYGLGDWCDLGPKAPGPAQLTPMALTATAVYFYDVRLLSEMAGILRKTEEQKNLESWTEEIKKAFNAKFFNPETGVYSTGSQTAMAMPLSVGLVDDSLQNKVLKNLVDSIRSGKNALTAGDIGFHYVVDALTHGGQSHLLFDINNRDDVPGYGYQLKKGATTLTESWAALEEVSNNHLMLGHLMEWLYQGIGGINQAENSTGYKEIVIRPEIVGNLTSANTSFRSPYGEISTEWEKTDDSFTLKTEIPANTSATVYLPFEGKVTINGQNPNIAPVPGVTGTENKDGKIICNIGSGKYTFRIIR